MRKLYAAAALVSLAACMGMAPNGCNLAGLPGTTAPTLTITAEPRAGNMGIVTFRTDLSGVPTARTVNWSFGDGSQAVNLSVAQGQALTHAFNRPDSFEVAVFAFDIAGKRLAEGRLAIVVDAPGLGGFVDARTRVRLHTNYGDIVMQMNRQGAPRTTANFERYVANGHYDNTVFHRVVSNFVIQGGAFRSLGEGEDPRLMQIPHDAAVQSEASADRKNVRGTVALALTGTDADSGMDQFFINLKDNPTLDTGDPHFTVFATVIGGMDVVDTIAGVPRGTFNVQTLTDTTSFSDVPVQDVVVISATRE